MNPRWLSEPYHNWYYPYYGGSWYAYGEERLGQGREAAKEFLRTNPSLLAEVESSVRKKFGLEFDDEEEVGAPVILDADVPVGE